MQSLYLSVCVVAARGGLSSKANKNIVSHALYQLTVAIDSPFGDHFTHFPLYFKSSEKFISPNGVIKKVEEGKEFKQKIFFAISL